jgi:hypothetical protein
MERLTYYEPAHFADDELLGYDGLENVTLTPMCLAY